MSRFTHGDEKIAQFVKEITAAEEEEYPDAIYAEIAHLPQARAGNILLRTNIRSYDIPYIGMSGLTPEFQIPVDDIMIRVQNNTVVLWSKKHNKQIMPRLSTAHNFQVRSLPVYKFLCDVQMQNTYQPVFWDWGILDSIKALPRVAYKNIIVKKAQWQLDGNDIANMPGDAEGQLAHFRELRVKYRIPQHVVLVEGDNELICDFECHEQMSMLLKYLKQHKMARLEEFLFTESNCIVRDVNGLPFTNEIIIPLKREAKKKITAAGIQNEPGKQVTRKFTPQSEWQYYKIYCGAKFAEKILKNVLLPFVDTGIRASLIEKFFFVRYHDNFPHLRVRFLNTDLDKQAALQKNFLHLLQPFVDDGLITQVALDTYSRELERYHWDLIEEAESLFHNDSIAVLRFLNSLDNDGSDKLRILFAIRGINAFLEDFKFSLAEKDSLIKSMQAGYFKEFGASPELQKQLNEKYRGYQKDVFSFLNSSNDFKNGFYDASAILKNRAKQNTPVIASLIKKLGDSENHYLADLLPSYIHMFMNRLFITQQRKYELVIYHFLEKYYSSQKAIQKIAG